MTLEIRLFAYLREGRGKKVYLDIVPGETCVQDVLDRLEIIPEHVSLLLINGKDAEKSSVFSEGDYLTIFPPVGGG